MFCLLSRRISILRSLAEFCSLIKLNKIRISNAIKKGRRVAFFALFPPIFGNESILLNIHMRGVCVCVCWGKLVQHSTKLFSLSHNPFRKCWKLEAFVFLDLVNGAMSRYAVICSRDLQ